MAYTNLSIGNFTLTDSLLFTNYNLLSPQAIYTVDTVATGMTVITVVTVVTVVTLVS